MDFEAVAHIASVERKALTGEVFLLEREYDEQLVHPGLQLLHAALPGCPHLGRDVIVHLEACVVGIFNA